MRRIGYILILHALLFSCDTDNNIDQRFEDYFVKYYGEDGDQEGIDVKALEDGFIILGNNTSTSGNALVYLVKVDKLGNQLWTSSFGGPGQHQAAALQVDAAGNFIIAATVNTESGDSDVMILKVDADGVKIDSAVFGNTGENDVASDITITREGDYILTGYTTAVDTSKPGHSASTDLEDIYSIRTTSDLEQFSPAAWRRVYGFHGIDRGVQVLQKEDGTFLFFGTTNRPPPSGSEKKGFNMFLFSAGADGLPISSAELKLLGTLSDESGVEIIPVKGGGFAMIGTSKNSESSQPFWARVRGNNDFISAGLVNASGNMESYSMIETNDGGFIILGKTTGADTDIYLTKRTINGAVIWERSFGGTDEDVPGKVLELENGGLIFTGKIELSSQSKICLIKTTKEGVLKP